MRSIFLLLGLVLLAGVSGGGVAHAQAPGTIFRDCADCPEMVVVPPGDFMMGAWDDDGIPEPWEQPVHRVTIARPFAVGRFEVTFDEWDLCVAEGGCVYRPDDLGNGRGRRPVIRVVYTEMQAFLQWLSLRTGYVYRLLSEAEWEYVARAGTTTPFYIGQTISMDDANFVDLGSGALPVGSYAPNPFGLYDIAGNVWEQVDDCFTDNYIDAPTNGGPWLTGDCSKRVQRGGSFAVFGDSHYVRSAHRSYQSDTLEYMGADEIEQHSTGFRVARDL